MHTRGGRHFSTDRELARATAARAAHAVRVGWADVFEEAGVRVASRDLLIAHGASGRMLTSAVRSGHLIRARRDHYLLPQDSRRLVEAVRVGGRMGCITALADSGVFAEDPLGPHIYIARGMSRMRSPRSRFLPLHDRNRNGAELHWLPLLDEENAAEFSVSVVDALAQALLCQPPWLALASVDNALFAGAVTRHQVCRIFETGPERLRYLEPYIDARAEAGQETILRMIVRAAGLECDLQVSVPDVGRVDMIVEGCLALEADSRLAHDGWERHVEDRHRDLLLAERGHMSLRPAYQHTMNEPRLVLASVLGLLRQSNHSRRIF
jgi:hypothetical protein